MRTITKKSWLRITGLTLALFSYALLTNAQQTDKEVANLGVIKNADVATNPVANGTVRLVDNKGTIKYLQVKNGLTAVTNKATDGTGVTTTWQLGGTLVEDTYIDASNKMFSLDGLALVSGLSGASSNATDKSVHSTATGTGWTVLIRDEATGGLKKILVSDLLQVQSGQYVYKATGAETAVNIGDGTNGTVDTTIPNVISKISVYRNGVKLVNGIDYTIVSGSTNQIKITPPTSGDWAFFKDDVVEAQWIK